MATFLSLLASGIGGFALTVRFALRGAKFAACFYAVFSLGLLLIAMEEIAWGQHLFGFQTPENWAALNVQRETTLHNLETMQGHNDYLRLIFGFGGLTGTFFGRFWRRIEIVCPDRLLLPWFLTIFGISSGQVLSDLVSHVRIARPLIYFDQLAEVVELLIGISAMLYLWLNARKYGPGRACGGGGYAQESP
jgi:hypothetical protein